MGQMSYRLKAWQRVTNSALRERAKRASSPWKGARRVPGVGRTGPVRLPRGGNHLSLSEGRAGPEAMTSMRKLRRRVRLGRSVTLYRGHKIMDLGGEFRRLKAVNKGQSWALSPRAAAIYANPLASDAQQYPGRGGLLYAITLPASEFKDVARKRRLRAWEDHDLYDTPKPDRGAWTAVDDAYGLELRSNRRRPGLKPKIVGTVMLDRDGNPTYSFARRLWRRRTSATRGGGA